MKMIRPISLGRKFLKRFSRSWSARFAIIFLSILVFFAVFADLLATDQPLYVSYRDHYWFPALTSIWNPTRSEAITDTVGNNREVLQFDIVNWKELALDGVVWAPVPWSPGRPDPLNRDYAGPFDDQKFITENAKVIDSPGFFRHHLGTDKLGNDLFAGLIHGCRVSLKIGLLATFIATVLGVLLGAFSGYFGNDRLYSTQARWYLCILGIALGYFWGFVSRIYVMADAFSAGFLVSVVQVLWSLALIVIFGIAFTQFGRLVNHFGILKKRVVVPLDSIIQRFSEVFTALPKLLIIITLAAVFREKSVGMVIAIIGLTNWTSVSRFTRAEMLKTRDLSYIESARSLGLPWYRVIFRHALPNAFAPVFIEVAFLISGSIVLESSLSFLGIGVPDNVVSWGSILSAGRQQFDAWWLVLFPGIAIFLTVLSLNILGESIRESQIR